MTDDGVKWKKKYYDSFAKLERCEEDWEKLENLFKQAVSRLSLAAEGKNKSLDVILKQLRVSIRENKDNQIIELLLENVSRELIELDKEKSAGPDGDSGFFNRFFSAFKDSSDSNDNEIANLNPQQLESVVSTVQNVLESIIDGMELQESVKEQLKDKVLDVKPTKEIHVLLDDLQDVFKGSGFSSNDGHGAQGNDGRLSFRKQNEQLLKKLQTLELENNNLLEQIQESESVAPIDPLTQLPEFLAYSERLRHEYARWKRYKNNLLIMVLDIDFFKTVIDNYGHECGDLVLKRVADLLKNRLRETDYIFRYGGEEFVSLMPETSLGGGFKVLEQIRLAISKLKLSYNNEDIQVTISGGITIFLEGDSIESAFERANEALYQAKQQGRNRCVIAKMI